MTRDTPPDEGFGLTDQDRALLLDIARLAILAGLNRKDFHPPEDLPDAVQQPGAAFVTLKKQGRLRGCIGHVEARLPLHVTVARMAMSAAFSDPRFPKLEPGEFEDLELEISVLTPLRDVDSPEDVRVGVHGLVVQRGTARGLLLPQVPVEWGWGRVRFLEQTCRKAGLPADAWKDPATRIWTFTAEVFQRDTPPEFQF